MVWIQLYVTIFKIMVHLWCFSKCELLLDGYGGKFYTLPQCKTDMAMPTANVDETFTGNMLECARQCKCLHEACGWMNFNPDAAADNCEFGNTPTNVSCSDLEQSTGTTFYAREPFCVSNSSYNATLNKCEPCPRGYTGQRCDIRAYDCSDYYFAKVYSNQPRRRDLYIWPEKSEHPYQVACLFYSPGYTYLMRQGRAAEADYFNLTWVNYTQGFGALPSDFHIGNKQIFEILSGSRVYQLRVVLADMDNKSYNVIARYSGFRIGNETEKFKITLSPENSNANLWYGDALFSGDNATDINGTFFSTYDMDNDGNATFNCANNFGGGWWFGPGCSKANIMGKRIIDMDDWAPSVWPQLSWGNMTEITGFKESNIQIIPHPYKAPKYILVI